MQRNNVKKPQNKVTEVCQRLTVGHEWCEDPQLAAGAENQARGQQVGVTEQPGQQNLILDGKQGLVHCGVTGMSLEGA